MQTVKTIIFFCFISIFLSCKSKERTSRIDPIKVDTLKITSTSNNNLKIIDTISGFYLTKSHAGFIQDNFEVLVLKDRPLIKLTDIKSAAQELDSYQRPYVLLTLNASGTRKLKTASRENIGKPMAIFIDNKIIMAPVIHSPIENGRVQITGGMNVAETQELANWFSDRIDH